MQPWYISHVKVAEDKVGQILNPYKLVYRQQKGVQYIKMFIFYLE